MASTIYRRCDDRCHIGRDSCKRTVGIIPDPASGQEPRCKGVNESEEKEEMVVTPWRVSGEVDYNRLIERFGTSPITDGIRDRM